MKESKGASTIRRKKNKRQALELCKLRQKCYTVTDPNSYFTDGDEIENESDSFILSDEFLGNTVLKTIMFSEKTILLGLIALRIVNALLIQTFFVPDEYWQSVEVAHNVVFRYGYVTWEWIQGLRGFMYPGLFTLLYKILSILHLDYRLFMIKMPQLLQAVMAAYGDLHLYKLSKKLSGEATAQWTLLAQVLSWFTLYMSTRTLSNSTESVLSLVALYHYPWPGKHNVRGSWRFILAAAVSVVIRPTAAITWVLLCAWHVQRNLSNYVRIALIYLIVGGSTLGLSALIDRLFYGHWLLVQYNFLKFNIFSGLGTFYGSHPWHWYITQGFPVIVFTHIYPFIRGAWISHNKVPLIIIIWNLFFYSLLGHKEFRFIYPVLPLCMYYCGVYLQAVASNKQPGSTTDSTQHHVDQSQSHAPNTSIDPSDTASDNSSKSASYDEHGGNDEINSRKSCEDNKWKVKMIVVLLVMSNLPVALYFCLIHQRGTISVMHYLSKQPAQHDNMSILFLMPCHSTPYYSYMHKNVTMRFLTCEPNLRQDPHYVDEADVFYNDPVSWLQSRVFDGGITPPSHVVYFDTLNKTVRHFLSLKKYKKCAEFFHSHVKQDRFGKYVTVSCVT